MKTLILGLTLLALGSLGAGGTPAPQTGPRHPVASDNATATCAFTFESGANDTFLNYCVTVNGNVAQFQTPAGHEHIRHGVVGEGYGICDTNTNTEYFDYSFFGDSPNWGTPVTGTTTPTSVKITRTTIDGLWTLTQTFTQVAGANPFLKVTMTLTNNAAVDRTIFVTRFTDAEPDHLFTSSMGATSNSAFAWDQTVVPNIGLRANFGIMLQGLALPQQHAPDLGPQAFVEDNAFVDPPPPCHPYTNFISGTPPESKGSIALVYQLGIPARTSKSVTVIYRGL